MPVRTSAVVASGLGLLTLIGVGAVFGESLVALVAPPTADTAANVAPGEAKRAAGAVKPTTSAASTAPTTPTDTSHATTGAPAGRAPAAQTSPDSGS